MRSILLLLVMGGLLWLVVSTFGRGTEVAQAGEPDGELLERPAAPVQRPPLEELPAEPVHVERPVVALPVQEPDGAQAPETEGRGGFDEDAIASALAFGDEIELARHVLHARQELTGFLKDAGRELPEARKALAVTLALGIDGHRDMAQRYAERFENSELISDREHALVEALLGGRKNRAVEAGVSLDAGPLVSVVELAMIEKAGGEALAAGHYREAARAYSTLVGEELDAGWEPVLGALRRWSAALMKAQEGYRWDRLGEWPSAEIEVRQGDSLTVIRQRFLKERGGRRICVGLIDRANGLQGRYLQPGETLRIPLDTVSVLVDLSAHWLIYRHGDEIVASWEVGVGKQSSQTRAGRYVVGNKLPEPTWFPQGRSPIPFGDPEHEIGTRWISWSRPDGSSSGSLGFHGTNDPGGVGKDVSNGCVRMHNEDVELLYEILPMGAPIEIRP